MVIRWLKYGLPEIGLMNIKQFQHFFGSAYLLLAVLSEYLAIRSARPSRIFRAAGAQRLWRGPML